MKAPIPLIVTVLFGMLLPGSQAAAQAPTADELRQLQQLSAEERALLIEALEEDAGEQQAPLEQPVVVEPRDSVSTVSPADAQSAGEKPELRPFGYDLFAGEPTTFAPATDIPVPVDYVIGPGDTIEVQLFGSQNSSHTLVVTRDGVLNFPELGPISVAGLRFSEVQETLHRRVSEQLMGVRSSISMGYLLQTQVQAILR